MQPFSTWPATPPKYVPTITLSRSPIYCFFFLLMWWGCTKSLCLNAEKTKLCKSFRHIYICGGGPIEKKYIFFKFSNPPWCVCTVQCTRHLTDDIYMYMCIIFIKFWLIYTLQSELDWTVRACTYPNPHFDVMCGFWSITTCNF